MDDAGLLDAIFDLAALGSFDRGRDVHRDRAELRVRHQALGTQDLAETTDDAHHVRGRDAAIEIDRAALDELHQVFCTDHVGASGTGFVSLRALGEHTNADGLAGALGQRDDTADHLVGVTRIDAEVERDFDRLVEL